MILEKYRDIEELKSDFEKVEEIVPELSPNGSKKNLFVGVPIQYSPGILGEDAKTCLALGNVVAIEDDVVKVYVHFKTDNSLVKTNDPLYAISLRDTSLYKVDLHPLLIALAANFYIEFNDKGELIELI